MGLSNTDFTGAILGVYFKGSWYCGGLLDNNRRPLDWMNKFPKSGDNVTNTTLQSGYLDNGFCKYLVTGHPFMTSTRRGEEVRLRWTGVRGVQPHVDVHTEN